MKSQKLAEALKKANLGYLCWSPAVIVTDKTLIGKLHFPKYILLLECSSDG